MSTTLSLAPSRKSKRISLTPLIDVVFILLLFFMLTSSFQRWHSVDMPNSATPSSSSSTTAEEPLFFLLHSSGELRIWPENTAWSSVEEINQADISSILSNRNAPSALLVPEHQSTLQTILSASEKLRSYGLKVSISEPVEKHDE